MRLSFALTINKPLGQTLPKGQLYVAVSRVRSMLGQNVLTLNKEDEPHGYIKNVVYKEVLNQVLKNQRYSSISSLFYHIFQTQ